MILDCGWEPVHGSGCLQVLAEPASEFFVYHIVLLFIP